MPDATASSARQAAPSETYGDVVKRLSTAQKSNRGAPGYSRWINRRLGRYTAAWAFQRGLAPNQVTAISSVLTFAAIAALAYAKPAWGTAAVVVVVLLAGYAVDSADGQLARLQGGGTPAGEWLDHVTDCAKVCAIHLAVGICWFRWYHLDHPAWLLIPLGYTLVSTVFFFAVILTDQLRRIYPAANASAATAPPAPFLRSIIVLPADYGVLCLVLLLTPAHAAFGVLYTLLLAANFVFLAGALRNWFRELKSLA
jgi:phosphatidylglycerophosphate synthase